MRDGTETQEIVKAFAYLRREEWWIFMLQSLNSVLTSIDDFIWGAPLMILILAGGLYLTSRLGLLQLRKLPLALKWMVKNEEGGEGEVTSFAALCTALSATIGTGNIVGVATAEIRGRASGSEVPDR